MSNRVDVINKLEDLRKSKIICYLTGDRQPFATSVAEDIIPILYRHLELIGDKKERIDLFLYTRGGDMVTPIRIVKLIRNYCTQFSVLVPYRCHSAGTLTCLGADQIVMSKLGELTPVDPTSNNHAFNPIGSNPQNLAQQMSLPVSVEDVRSYLFFAKEILKGKQEQILDLYSKMTDHSYPNNYHLHPLALGNVYRVQKMIRQITLRLLAMHFKEEKDKTKSKKIIDKIVKEITEDISVHNYPIYFDQAKELELTVQRPSSQEEKLIWELYELYAADLKLSIPFNALDEIGANPSINGDYQGAYIESVAAEDAFNFSYQIARPNAAIPNQLVFNIAKSLWTKVR